MGHKFIPLSLSLLDPSSPPSQAPPLHARLTLSRRRRTILDLQRRESVLRSWIQDRRCPSPLHPHLRRIFGSSIGTVRRHPPLDTTLRSLPGFDPFPWVKIGHKKAPHFLRGHGVYLIVFLFLSRLTRLFFLAQVFFGLRRLFLSGWWIGRCTGEWLS